MKKKKLQKIFQIEIPKETNASQPSQSKENKLNLLFDKLLPSNEPLLRQSQIFINDDATKKIIKESVDKRINISEYSNDRKKLKKHSSSNNFKSIELKSNEKDSKQKQSNSFESMFDNLISKRK